MALYTRTHRKARKVPNGKQKTTRHQEMCYKQTTVFRECGHTKLEIIQCKKPLSSRSSSLKLVKRRLGSFRGRWQSPDIEEEEVEEEEEEKENNPEPFPKDGRPGLERPECKATRGSVHIELENRCDNCTALETHTRLPDAFHYRVPSGETEEAIVPVPVHRKKLWDAESKVNFRCRSCRGKRLYANPTDRVMWSGLCCEVGKKEWDEIQRARKEEQFHEEPRSFPYDLAREEKSPGRPPIPARNVERQPLRLLTGQPQRNPKNQVIRDAPVQKSSPSALLKSHLLDENSPTDKNYHLDNVGVLKQRTRRKLLEQSIFVDDCDLADSIRVSPSKHQHILQKPDNISQPPSVPLPRSGHTQDPPKSPKRNRPLPSPRPLPLPYNRTSQQPGEPQQLAKKHWIKGSDVKSQDWISTSSKGHGMWQPSPNKLLAEPLPIAGLKSPKRERVPKLNLSKRVCKLKPEVKEEEVVVLGLRSKTGQRFRGSDELKKTWSTTSTFLDRIEEEGSSIRTQKSPELSEEEKDSGEGLMASLLSTPNLPAILPECEWMASAVESLFEKETPADIQEV